MRGRLDIIAAGWPWAWVMVALVINILAGYWLVVIGLNFVIVGLAVIERRGAAGVRATLHRRTQLRRARTDGQQLAAHLERSRRSERRTAWHGER